MNESNIKDSAINRLTALWALSEAGLGGVMHALKIPFTGFFVGGFAVVLISIIAYFSDCNFKKIIQATLLVLLVKAGASPHSPVTAYLAVSFQGLIGATIFYLLKHNRYSCVLFGALALLESAIQKLLVTTLIFGKSIWQAIDIFMESILKDFHLTNEYSYSEIIIFIYVLSYLILGVYLGLVSASLPQNIFTKKNYILNKFAQLPANEQQFKFATKKTKFKWLNYFLLLGFLVILFLVADQFSKAMYIFIRSVVVMLFIFLVIHPIVILLLNNFSKKRKGQIEIVTNQIDEIKKIVRPAYQISLQEIGFFKRFYSFILALIILSLYGLKEDQ
jgi:hypothetical protein